MREKILGARKTHFLIQLSNISLWILYSLHNKLVISGKKRRKTTRDTVCCSKNKEISGKYCKNSSFGIKFSMTGMN